MRFFKSMGTGQWARMNEVPAGLHARAACGGADTMDYFKRGRDVHDSWRPPRFGHAPGRVMDGDAPPTAEEKRAEAKARLREEGMRRRRCNR